MCKAVWCTSRGTSHRTTSVGVTEAARHIYKYEHAMVCVSEPEKGPMEEHACAISAPECIDTSSDPNSNHVCVVYFLPIELALSDTT